MSPFPGVLPAGGARCAGLSGDSCSEVPQGAGGRLAAARPHPPGPGGYPVSGVSCCAGKGVRREGRFGV